jgi:putative ABC transport system substrate-binding protein
MGQSPFASIRRRALLAAGAMGACARLVHAQDKPASRALRIGLVPDFAPGWWESMLSVFTQAMRELGRVEGRDYDYVRSGLFFGADAQQAVERVMRSRPDLIFVSNLAYAAAVHKVTQTIPVVMWVSGFPVEGGLAESLTHPGGNVTGLTIYASGEAFGKLVQLIHETRPAIKRVGTLNSYVPPFHPVAERDIVVHGMQGAAHALGLDLRVFEIAKAEQTDDALARIARDRIEALVLTSGPAIHPRRHDIMHFAVERHLPTITDAG